MQNLCDGTQVRDFIHVDDLVRIISLSLESKNLPSEMNIASGIGTSLLDSIEILRKLNPEMLSPIFEDERAATYTLQLQISHGYFTDGRIDFNKGVLVMKIVWLSSRVLGSDLCSTTQIQLANGLVDKGHSVDFYSPGKSIDNQFTHHQIPIAVKDAVFRLEAFPKIWQKELMNFRMQTSY